MALYADFTRLYPDVDPELPLPLSSVERLGIAVAAGILAYGGAAGHLAIAGAGAAVLLLTVYGISTRPPRRLRSEARSRFPDLNWYEADADSQLKLGWALPLVWLAIMTLCAVCLFFASAEYALTGAAICAIIAVALVWFAPGLSTAWKVSSPLSKSQTLMKSTTQTRSIPSLCEA